MRYSFLVQTSVSRYVILMRQQNERLPDHGKSATERTRCPARYRCACGDFPSLRRTFRRYYRESGVLVDVASYGHYGVHLFFMTSGFGIFLTLEEHVAS